MATTTWAAASTIPSQNATSATPYYGDYAILSNGNLTANTGLTGNTYSQLISSTSQSSGKYYWELTINAMNLNQYDMSVGICNSSVTMAATPGSSGYAGVWMEGTGSYYAANGDGFSGSVSGAGTGTVIGIAIDATNQLIWISKDGTWGAGTDPSSNVGGWPLAMSGPYYATQAFYNFYSDTTMQVTANFGATSFANAIPTGFVAWDYEPPSGGDHNNLILIGVG